MIADSQRAPHSPRITLSKPELLAPGRVRDSSTKSIESRLSDSDTEVKEIRDPPSPIGPIPEIDEMQGTGGAPKVPINYQSLDRDIGASEDDKVMKYFFRPVLSIFRLFRQNRIFDKNCSSTTNFQSPNTLPIITHLPQ